MSDLLQKAALVKSAARQMTKLSTEEKNDALLQIADALQNSIPEIIKANLKDLQLAEENGSNHSYLDRLRLTEERISDISNALRKLVNLPDPIGDVLEEWSHPNHMQIRKVRVPLGVVGMVYEARPNVTVDATGLCLKTGNAVYLRGSSSALNTNKCLVKIIQNALKKTAIPSDAVQLLEDVSRETATQFFQLKKYLDVLIPRGSASLIQAVLNQASVPVIETGAGNCHLYIDDSASFDMAVSISLNAKVQRPSVCNSVETIIIHRSWFDSYGESLLKKLTDANVECRLDQTVAGLYPDFPVATEEDWETEYNDYIVAIKIVEHLDKAIEHINRYSTKHSEAIVSETQEHVDRFFQEVDASTLYHNASTRFTDGEEFGFGAEIGISTQKLHARGPMGLPVLTTIKYLVNGQGQIR
ncbi:glutamate-5-semialdehyde dehydrogenase [Terrilactibacillus laevilacticus]|uniref:Gamma-glutamyl phosphate reductase n=1 Tax=Terrilactibacillus laevilacticus TaxID=1380157 RepID=A0ABW5PUC5_9BACI|nr:glutamate-5-semialdehyde dehydrogenase [Terrilactibacillus laevilacticus]